MIYWLLFYEFFKIGLFAVGGGAVTIPFLFDLSGEYGWFTTEQLADMIAVSESTPGPLGVNMATFTGYRTGGIFGGIIATAGLVLPSLIIIILVSKLLNRFACNSRVQTVLSAIRPAVLALIISAGWQIARISITGPIPLIMFAAIAAAGRIYPKSPVFYIILSAAAGIGLQL